jgi:hypothetical protein
VGTEGEAAIFQTLAGSVGKFVPWVKTPTLLDLARVVAGCGVLIGNQSTPMALALGMGKNVIQECWQGNPNCLFRRTNAIYWGVSTVDPGIAIPEDWLRVTHGQTE